MDDIVGRIFGYIAGILFMIFVPLIISMQLADNITQRYIDNSIERFKNICLTNGEITEENYQRLLSDLSSSGYTFDVDIEYYENVAYTNNVSSLSGNYLGHGNDEIIEHITAKITTDANGNSIIIQGIPYDLKQGDYIKISVSSKDDSYGSKIANALTLGALSRSKFHGIDGGMIRTNG